MRLLVLTTSWPSGPFDPAGSFVKEMTEALEDYGFDSKVIALDAPTDGALAAWGRGKRMALVRPVASMAHRALHAQADVVLSHWLLPSAFIGSMLELPHVGVAHGGDVRLLDSLPLVRNAIVDRLDGLIAVSNDAADLLHARHTLIQPMGVFSNQLGPPRPLPPRSPLKLLFLGRLVAIKGLPTLIKAVCGMENVELTVAGDGPLRTLAAAAPRNVRFVGQISLAERRDLVAQHHVVCVPSLIGEGSPRVVAEAMAGGRAVLGSDVGGIAERVPADWRVEPGDVLAWRRAIGRLRNPRVSLKPPLTPAAVDWAPASARIAQFIRQCHSRHWDQIVGRDPDGSARLDFQV